MSSGSVAASSSTVSTTEEGAGAEEGRPAAWGHPPPSSKCPPGVPASSLAHPGAVSLSVQQRAGPGSAGSSGSHALEPGAGRRLPSGQRKKAGLQVPETLETTGA